MASGPNTHASLDRLLKDTLQRLTLVERRLATQGGGSGGSSVVPGMITAHGGGSVPGGWLLCDGAAVSRTTYAALFTAIGTTYGTGDGSTTFNLPNLKGKVPVGRDGSQVEFDVLGETGGEKAHPLTSAELPFHRHTFGGDDGVSAQGGYTSVGTFAYDATSTITGGGQHMATRAMRDFNNNIIADGSAATTPSHNNLQPYLVTNWIIATASGNGIQPTYLTNQGTTAERDAMFGQPVTAAEIAALANRKVSWYNTDLGWHESYYATTGTAGLTVTGLVATAASGWYPNDRGPVISLTPTTTQTMTTGNSFIRWGEPGTGSSWRKGGTAYFTYTAGTNGRITAVRAGRYRVLARLVIQNGSGSCAMYLVVNAATNNPLDQWKYDLNSNYGTMGQMEAPSVLLNAGDYVHFYAASLNSAAFGGPDYGAGQFMVEYVGPPLVTT